MGWYSDRGRIAAEINMTPEEHSRQDNQYEETLMRKR